MFRLVNRSSFKQGLHKYMFNTYTEIAVINEFINGSYGSQYGITKKDKENLIKQIYDQRDHVQYATPAVNHVVLVREVLSIPKETKGAVIECGAFKGSTSVSLSLACRMTGRKLLVCDSFEGLPAEESDIVRNYPHLKIFGYYDEGMYKGELDEVVGNISKYGAIDVCEFHKGFFSQSLQSVKEPLAFAFFDVDLTSSMKDCIQYIWPLMEENCLVYTDDSCDMEVVKIWFNDGWWKEQFGIEAPGYVGSGCGLPLDYDICSLGYCRKVGNISREYERANWLRYRD